MNLDIFDNKKIENDINDFLKKNDVLVSDKFSIDRFEENFAVCENKRTKQYINIPKLFISKEVKEGQIVKLENNLYVLDNEAYQKQAQEVKELAKSLFKRKDH